MIESIGYEEAAEFLLNKEVISVKTVAGVLVTEVYCESRACKCAVLDNASEEVGLIKYN